VESCGEGGVCSGAKEWDDAFEGSGGRWDGEQQELEFFEDLFGGSQVE
jgi:hypothetical protein